MSVVGGISLDKDAITTYTHDRARNVLCPHTLRWDAARGNLVYERVPSETDQAEMTGAAALAQWDEVTGLFSRFLKQEEMAILLDPPEEAP